LKIERVGPSQFERVVAGFFASAGWTLSPIIERCASATTGKMGISCVAGAIAPGFQGFLSRDRLPALAIAAIRAQFPQTLGAVDSMLLLISSWSVSFAQSGTKRGKAMNKLELVEHVANETDSSKAAAAAAIDAVLEGITKTLKKGEEVRLVGFGTFSVKKRAAGKGRNPATGEEIKIPASKNARFKPGATLKAALNKTK
jgi:DNA-binding protein HU-beta